MFIDIDTCWSSWLAIAVDSKREGEREAPPVLYPFLSLSLCHTHPAFLLSFARRQPLVIYGCARRGCLCSPRSIECSSSFLSSSLISHRCQAGRQCKCLTDILARCLRLECRVPYAICHMPSALCQGSTWATDPTDWLDLFWVYAHNSHEAKTNKFVFFFFFLSVIEA